jgi:hypothetical protein
LTRSGTQLFLASFANGDLFPEIFSVILSSKDYAMLSNRECSADDGTASFFARKIRQFQRISFRHVNSGKQEADTIVGVSYHLGHF